MPRQLHAKQKLAALLAAAYCAFSPAATKASADAITAAAPALELDLPSVARPRYQVDGRTLGSGTAFFLKVAQAPGAVALTTAHAHDLDALAAAGEIFFELVHSQTVAASSNRYWVKPGRAYSQPGATLADDYIAFALDAAPRGARALTPSAKPPQQRVGERVRLLGVPAHIAQDQDDLWGTLTAARETELDVLLDVPHDLRGWGGAPVVSVPEGEVIGLVQAATPEAGTYRLGVAPIGPIAAALRLPAQAGLGIPMALGAQALAAAEAQNAAAADAVSAAVAAAAAEAEAAVDLGGASADLNSAAERFDAPRGPLLGRAGALSTNLKVDIEYPQNNASIGDKQGAFIAGRALALLGEFKRFDVLFVIDRSASAAMSTGVDLNGNGRIGQDRAGGLFGQTDPGDSILAAELMAARRVLQSLDARNTRVGIITFHGREPDHNELGTVWGYVRPDAVTEIPLTADYRAVARMLARIQQRGVQGKTNMTEAIRLAVRELRGFRGALSQLDPESKKIVMFFTDGEPTLPYAGRGANVRSVLRAAGQAQRADVVIHSFAIGPNALAQPVATVGMARATGGYFTPVREPADLVDVVENVSFANIEKLEIKNATTNEDAYESNNAADGSFAALVPLQNGRNVIEVRAVAADGTELTERITVLHAPGVQSPRVPPGLMGRRGALLEQRLRSLQRGRIAAERERAEKVRRELQLEIEREREKAEANAARQRRELRIEVEGEAEEDDANDG